MPSTKYPEDFEARFNHAYGMVAYVTSRHYGHHLRRILVELKLDLESAYIMGTLSQLNVATELTPGSQLDAVLDVTGRLQDSRMKSVRLVDLTQITGLPRETVRRKLEHLRRLGRVERTPARGWKLCTSDEDEDFRTFIHDTVVRLQAVAKEVNSVLGYSTP